MTGLAGAARSVTLRLGLPVIGLLSQYRPSRVFQHAGAPGNGARLCRKASPGHVALQLIVSLRKPLVVVPRTQPWPIP